MEYEFSELDVLDNAKKINWLKELRITNKNSFIRIFYNCESYQDHADFSVTHQENSESNMILLRPNMSDYSIKIPNCRTIEQVKFHIYHYLKNCFGLKIIELIG